jgi:hypothetical protein
VNFAYDEIGIKFTEEILDALNEVGTFELLLNRAVIAYDEFREYFLRDIVPNSINVKFEWQSLLLVLYGFFKGLETEKRQAQMAEVQEILSKYTAHPKIMEDLSEKKNRPDQIRIVTIKEIEEEEKLEFKTVILSIGEENQFYVQHHLFAKSYFVDDLSSGLTTLAEWGFMSSLMLTDFHMKNNDYTAKIKELQKTVAETKKQRVPLGLDTQQESTMKLEKKHRLIEQQRREFLDLSEKLFESIRESKKGDVYELPDQTRSLPNSLHPAYGVLTVNKLGVFSRDEEVLDDLRSDLDLLEIKLKKTELYSIIISLVVAVSALSGINFFTPFKIAPEVAYFSDTLGILTFFVALMILTFRFSKSR